MSRTPWSANNYHCDPNNRPRLNNEHSTPVRDTREHWEFGGLSPIRNNLPLSDRDTLVRNIRRRLDDSTSDDTEDENVDNQIINPGLFAAATGYYAAKRRK